MVEDRLLLPQIDEILDNTKTSSVFTAIDIFHGYGLIKMGETCEDKTAFIRRYGTFQFEVKPFGLINCQATFYRMMNGILMNVGFKKYYMDDIFVFSKDEVEHLMQLFNAFTLLAEDGLNF